MVKLWRLVYVWCIFLFFMHVGTVYLLPREAAFHSHNIWSKVALRFSWFHKFVSPFSRKLGISWELVLQDNDKANHAFSVSDAFHFPTSCMARWYHLEFPPVKSLRGLSIIAKAPVFFKKDGSMAENRSVLWKYPNPSINLNPLPLGILARNHPKSSKIHQHAVKRYPNCWTLMELVQ